MNAPSTNTPEARADMPAPAPTFAPIPASRLLYWSVLREIWENRSLYIAPLIVASLALFGFFISTVGLAKKMRGLEALDPVKQLSTVIAPYSTAASIILLLCFVIGAYYCLGALNGERRDRSILFWKSMPVSDRMTVLAKACIPIAVLPVIGFTIVLATQLIMLISSTSVLIVHGMSPSILWIPLPMVQMTLTMLYGIAVHALWYAPIYAFLLLVSAWAQRAVFLWAVIPLFALAIVEKMGLGTLWLFSLIRHRLLGGMSEAFALDALNKPITHLSQLDPLKFLSSPGLWVGLAVAALCLAAAIQLRRNREPI